MNTLLHTNKHTYVKNTYIHVHIHTHYLHTYTYAKINTCLHACNYIHIMHTNMHTDV